MPHGCIIARLLIVNTYTHKHARIHSNYSASLVVSQLPTSQMCTGDVATNRLIYFACNKLSNRNECEVYFLEVKAVGA